MFIFPLPPQGRHKGEKRPKRRCGVGFSDFMVLLPPEEDSFLYLSPLGRVSVCLSPSAGRRDGVSLSSRQRGLYSLPCCGGETCLFSPLPDGRGTQKCPKRRCGVGFSDFMVLLPPEEDSFLYLSPLGRVSVCLSPSAGRRDGVSLSSRQRGLYSLPCCGGETCLFSPLPDGRGTQKCPKRRCGVGSSDLMVILPGRWEDDQSSRPWWGGGSNSLLPGREEDKDSSRPWWGGG